MFFQTTVLRSEHDCAEDERADDDRVKDDRRRALALRRTAWVVHFVVKFPESAKAKRCAARRFVLGEPRALERGQTDRRAESGGTVVACFAGTEVRWRARPVRSRRDVEEVASVRDARVRVRGRIGRRICRAGARVDRGDRGRRDGCSAEDQPPGLPAIREAVVDRDPGVRIGIVGDVGDDALRTARRGSG